jgi:hypothetical protein
VEEDFGSGDNRYSNYSTTDLIINEHNNIDDDDDEDNDRLLYFHISVKIVDKVLSVGSRFLL